MLRPGASVWVSPTSFNEYDSAQRLKISEYRSDEERKHHINLAASVGFRREVADRISHGLRKSGYRVLDSDDATLTVAFTFGTECAVVDRLGDKKCVHMLVVHFWENVGKRRRMKDRWTAVAVLTTSDQNVAPTDTAVKDLIYRMVDETLLRIGNDGRWVVPYRFNTNQTDP